jgi:hypothetical protein
MIGARVTIEGLDVAVKRVEFLSEAALTALETEMQIAALDLAGKASMRAPVRTGDLRGSWFAVTNKENLLQALADSDPDSSRLALPSVGKYEIAVGFSEPYAEKQHETLTFRHELGGEAKFLENPFKEMSKTYVDNIGAAIKKAVSLWP